VAFRGKGDPGGGDGGVLRDAITEAMPAKTGSRCGLATRSRVHDNRAIFQESPDDLPVIDIQSL